MADISEETISGGTAAQNRVTPVPVTPKPPKQQQRQDIGFAEPIRVRDIPGFEQELSRYNMDAIVPATGERVGEWFTRRLTAAYGGGLPLKIAMELSAEGISDKEFYGLVRAARTIYGPNLPASIATQIGEAEDVVAHAERAAASTANIAARKRATTRKLTSGLALSTGGVIESLTSSAEEEAGLKETVLGALEAGAGAAPVVLDAPYKYVVSPVLATALQLFWKLPLVEPAKIALHATTGLTPANQPIEKVLENAVKLGPGRSMALEMGMKPGTTPFKVSSASIDLVARWYADPLVLGTNYVKGVKLAGKIPTGRTGAIPTVSGKAITQFAYARNAKDPLTLLRGKPVVKDGKTVFVGAEPAIEAQDAMWASIARDRAAGKPVNVERLRDQWLGDAKAAQAVATAETREEVTDILLELMHGRIVGKARPAMEVELAAKEAELGTIDTTLQAAAPGQSIDDVAAMLADARHQTSVQRAAELALEVAELRTALQGDFGRTILTQVPEETWFGNLRQAVKRGGDTRTSRILHALSQRRWLNQFTKVFPNEPTSVKLKDQGVVQIERAGRILELPRERLDDFLNRYIAATSKGEVTEIIHELLREGAKGLPPTVAAELTRVTLHPSQSVYAVNRFGERVGTKFRRGWAKVVKKNRGETAYAQPLIPSHLQEAVPWPDFRDIQELKTLRGRLRRWVYEHGGEVVSGPVQHFAETSPLLGAGRVRRGALEAARKTSATAERLAKFGVESSIAISKMASLFTSIIWKPAVLIRLGYPLRVVTEEQIRMAAAEVPSLFRDPFQWAENLKLARQMLRKGVIPEEVLSNMARDTIGKRVSGRGVIFWGEAGAVDALQSTLSEISNDRLTRYYLDHGRAKTIDWLKTGKGRSVLRDHQPILGQIGDRGAMPDEWVDTVIEWLDDTLVSRELLDAVRNGYVYTKGGEKVGLKSAEFRGWLRELGDEADKVPQHVKNIVDFNLIEDGKYWRRFTGRLMNIVGSKPTNLFSRATSYIHFQKVEAAHLRTVLGEGNEQLVAKMAKSRAIERTNDLLYRLGERSAWHEANRNVAPFLGAWQEVATRWAFTIPTGIGGGNTLLGYAYMQRRADALFDALQDLGAVTKNEDGNWVLRIKGVSKFLAWYHGVKGQEADFELRRANFAAGFPFSGPVLTHTLGRLLRKNDLAAKIFDQLSIAPDATTGPAWAGRFWTGMTGSPPPWEPFVAEYQGTLFDGSKFDIMRSRHKEFDAILKRVRDLTDPLTQRPLEGKKAEYDAAQADVREFYHSVHVQTQWFFMKRGILSVLTPISPRLYMPNEKEMQAWRDRLNEAPYDEQRSMYQKLLEDQPGMALYIVGKSRRLKGEAPREFSQREYWLDWRKGNIERLSFEEMSKIGEGYVNEAAIRESFREKKAALGETGADWLHNAHEWNRLTQQEGIALDGIAYENPMWRDAKDAIFARAAAREGKPLPSYEEKLVMDWSRDISILEEITRQHGDELGPEWGELRRLRAKVKERFGIDRFYSDKELPAGPERDIAWWFDNVYHPYAGQEDAILSQEAKTPEEQSRIYEELRRLRANTKPVTHEGKEFPTPEEWRYNLSSPAEREATKNRWATGKVEYLTPFQRKQLGMADTAQSTTFWNVVNEARLRLREWRRANHLSPSSKDYRDAKAALDERSEALAGALGMNTEWRLSRAEPYRRARYFGFGKGSPFWEKKVFPAIDNLWAHLIANEQSPSTKYGIPRMDAFNAYIFRLRETYGVFDDELTELQDSIKRFRDKPPESFHNYFFFGIGD